MIATFDQHAFLLKSLWILRTSYVMRILMETETSLWNALMSNDMRMILKLWSVITIWMATLTLKKLLRTESVMMRFWTETLPLAFGR